MNAQPNIFEKLATDNNYDDFTFSQPNPIKQGATAFQDIQNIEVDSQSQKDPANIFEQMAIQKKEKDNNQFGFLDTVKDVGEQILTKGVSGVGGAYGNILDAFGLQMEPGTTLPGQEARNSAQFEVLQKISRGEKPSWGELMLLSDDDDILPVTSRIASSKEIQGHIEDLTGIGEGKTASGRMLGHGAQFLGEGVALGGGGKALATLGGSGIAGQGIRELGGPEWLASTAEILPSIVQGVTQGKLFPKRGSAAEDLVNAGRKIGLTESQITPLVQGEGKMAVVSKVARKGTKTKELFGSIKEKLGDSYSRIKSVKEAKVKLPNADQIRLRKEFGNIRNELSKTLAPSPDKEAALNYIEKSLETLRNVDITPEHLINFWQDINKSVKWNSISGGKKALTQLKKPVSEVLERISPQLAQDFEMTNQLYSKYAQISKKLKPDIVDAFVNKGEILSAPAAGLALVQGNPWFLAGLAGESSLRVLGREMLINPYFQDIGRKLVNGFNSGSAKGVTELVEQVQDYMTRKHPKEDWSFLTSD